LHYLADYLKAAEATELLIWLLDRAPWRQETLRMFGREVAAPRLTGWYGDAGIAYRYSGVTHHACGGWPERLDRLRDALSVDLDAPFNFVLLNRYRHGRDSMGWHADDELELMGPIASVSLGATRRFLVRASGATCSTKFDLEHGSVLVMPAGEQQRSRHALPKTARPVAERVNLTFRCVAR
jgi:alkylated DNA repair dioxygenase AlkB